MSRLLLSLTLVSCAPALAPELTPPSEELTEAPATLRSFATAYAQAVCDAAVDLCATSPDLLTDIGCGSTFDLDAEVAELESQCLDFDATIAEVCLTEAFTCFVEPTFGVSIPIPPNVCADVCDWQVAQEDPEDPQTPTPPPANPIFNFYSSGGVFELAMTGPTGDFRLGWAATGALGNDPVFTAEDCDGFNNDEGVDVCHPLQGAGATHYLTLEDATSIHAGSQSRLAGYYELASEQFTFVVEDLDSDACWVWGEDPTWYTEWNHAHCTIIVP